MAEDAEVGSISGNGDCKDKTVKKLLSKNLNRATDYLAPKARLVFTKLRKSFTKAPIFRHFDPEFHIWIETDMSSYAISRVLSQLTLDNLGQWHSVAFYSQKMILAKTWYKTPNDKPLTIVEDFKTWQYYLEGCKNKVLVFTNQNNLCHIMDTKSLSSRQVCWAQELFKYHFWIDYCQGKTNGAANALFCFF